MPDDQESTDQNDQTDDDQNDEQDAKDDGEAKTFSADYVKKLRDENAKHRKAAADARADAKKLEDRDKSESQKLQERAAEAEKKATASTTELARMRVALRKGLTESQAKRLIGDSEEDLEKDADELLASFKTDDGAGGDQSRRPRERLRPGAAPSAEPEETNPEKLAAQVPRMY